MTIVNPMMIHILLVLSLITVVDLLIRRSGNGDVTKWLTNLDGRSHNEILVMIGDSRSSIHIRIIK
jgi:hypothetical protein